MELQIIPSLFVLFRYNAVVKQSSVPMPVEYFVLKNIVTSVIIVYIIHFHSITLTL